jgi:dolichol-phosphate mannosyltransferase
MALASIISNSPWNAVGCGVAAAVFLVGGALLLCLGVLGEYLGRVYDEVRQRPLSVINKVYYATDMAAALDRLGELEDEQPAKVVRIA